jgi:ankyrin repeat protein
VSTNELFEAIQAGDENRALQVLDTQPDLARTRDDGLSPLMQALYHGLNDLAIALRRATGDLDVFEAASVGDVERLRELVPDGSAANAWSTDGFTALHLASFFGQPKAAGLLIERGADIEASALNQRFAAGAHPLHSAVAAQQQQVIALLLKAGADPNSKQHGGFTPLLEAAQLGNADLAELLLAHGADPRAQLDDGRTAAELAEEAGNQLLAERLRTRPTHGRRTGGLR